MVHEGLSKKSLEAFLPKIQVRSRRRDRVAMIQVPLFPGYLFVKSAQDAYEHLEILKTTGVVRFIGNREGPLPVPDDNIESLKIMVSGTDAVSTGRRFKKGDKVIVVNGPLTGVTGFFILLTENLYGTALTPASSNYLDRSIYSPSAFL